jgi:hypothetical protein
MLVESQRPEYKGLHEVSDSQRALSLNNRGRSQGVGRDYIAMRCSGYGFIRRCSEYERRSAMLRAGRRQCGRISLRRARFVNLRLVELEADPVHSEQAPRGEVHVL